MQNHTTLEPPKANLATAAVVNRSDQFVDR